MAANNFPPVGIEPFFLLTMVEAGSILLQNEHPTFVVEYLGVQLAIPVLTEAKEPAPKVGAVDVMGLDLAL